MTPEIRRECIAFLMYGAGPDLDTELALARLIDQATEVSADAGDVLTRQYAPARSLFLLVEGSVRFQIQLEEGNEDLDVGSSDTPWTPVGWSGFRSPGRYATTVVCRTPSRLVRFEHSTLRELFAEHPRMGVRVLESVLKGCQALLTEMRARLASYSRTPVNFAQALQADGEEETYNRAPPVLIELLRASAFFEIFGEPDLRRLAGAAEGRYFCRGEPIINQGDSTPGLWVLATGRVAVNHRPQEHGEAFALRTLSNPGSVVGWAGLAGIAAYSTSVVATRDCTVYRIDPRRLADHLDADPGFAQELTRRLLWLVASQLRAARALFISRRFEQEILAVRNLLEQSCTQLDVSSPLHRLPHLLDSPLTLGDAFTCIDHQLAHSADPLERNLAQLCQDMLTEVKREHDFFEALRRVYHAVVTAPPEMPTRDVRKLCARGFREAFGRVRYVVEGEAHLPATPGHIFIFNHLKNHEFNTLPNNFQLTLDSHFVSSVILDRQYGDSGVRVVRRSRGTEYGHQYYYDRLGHISVYTRESDELDETDEEKQIRRSEFFETAGACLADGVNLILSPEGTSYWTEDSPGPFKPGAFKLAASVEPEPWIVPIAVAHFDRRVHSTTYAVVIQAPFKISDSISVPLDPKQMSSFLESYRQTYVGYVQAARDLAEREAARRDASRSV